MVEKGKNTVPWTYVVIDFNGEEILRMFHKNNWKNQIQKCLELRK